MKRFNNLIKLKSYDDDKEDVKFDDSIMFENSCKDSSSIKDSYKDSYISLNINTNNIDKNIYTFGSSVLTSTIIFVIVHMHITYDLPRKIFTVLFVLTITLFTIISNIMIYVY